MKKKWDKLGNGNHYSVVIPAPTKTFGFDRTSTRLHEQILSTSN